MKRYFDLSIPNPRVGDDEIDITVRAERVDNGIGAYEYWGAKGTHHQWEIEWVLESCPIPDDEIYDDRKLCDEIQERVDELWEEGENYEEEREDR